MLTSELAEVRRIISHANCPDGMASAMILKDALPSATVELVQYGTTAHQQLACTPGMLFCDMSPPAERVAEFVEAGAIVLDHHKSAKGVIDAFGERGVYADAELEPGVSGALLAYMHVWRLLDPRAEYGPARFADTPGLGWTLPSRSLAFSMLAGVRDTWQTHDPRWPEACAQAQALLFWGEQRLLGDGHPPWLSAEELEVGRVLYQQQLRRADDVARNLYVLGVFAFFNDTTAALVSDVAEAVRSYPKGPPESLVTIPAMHARVLVSYAVKTNDARGLRYAYSLRALDDDVDVSELAALISGGGHKGAAGGYIDMDPQVMVLPEPCAAFLGRFYPFNAFRSLLGSPATARAMR